MAAMKTDAKKPDHDALEDAWTSATRLFATSKAMRPRLSWVTGVSVDTASDRIQRLLGEPRAQALRKILAALDAGALRRFLERAEINLDRAAAAMRLNLIVNISAPVGALVIVNQLFPQAVATFVAEYGMESIVVGSACVLFLLLLSIWYSYCCVTQARDLAHLTRLFGMQEVRPAVAAHDLNDEPLNPAELA